MPQELINIFLAAFGTILSGLATWGVAAFTKWINTKIKDQKCATYLITVTDLTTRAVCEVYQTYVEAIKAEDKFDKEAQEKALEMCITKIKSQLAPEILDYIGHNFGDVTDYLKTLIESTIYNLKR